MALKLTTTNLAISLLGAAGLLGCGTGGEGNTGAGGSSTATAGSSGMSVTSSASTSASTGASASSGAGGAGDSLQVPSPAWQDQIIYFVMTDRFDDGDPTNNNQHATEYDPKDGSRYSGGDLKGVIDRLDYIHGLGATAVWVTPPVANQWVDPLVNYTGYHGYWAENFREVDKHYGTLETYKALSRALHQKGMYLIQDVVVNHTGNFFTYEKGYDPKDPTKGYIANTKSLPHTAPTLAPFNLNDPRRPEDRAAAIYHFTPAISDYQDQAQRYNYQQSDLDDLNTENPVVASALRDAYRYWVETVGVDAFRLDSALSVPPAFYGGFVNATDEKDPGMREHARRIRSDKDDFLVFGEPFVNARPYDDSTDKLVETLIRDEAGNALLSSALNFPLHVGMQDAFASGHPTAELTYRLDASMKDHKDPYRMVNFLDNHDKARFLTIGSEAGLRQGLLFMMTTPGIPAIYYGTEQGLLGQRDAMFKGGVGSGGKDHFDTSAPLYGFIHDLSVMRAANAVLRRGVPTVLKDSKASAGVLAYAMKYQGKSAFVLFNTADRAVLLDNMATGLPAGTKLTRLFDLEGKQGDVVVSAEGLITMALAPRAGLVLLQTDEVVSVPPGGASVTVSFPANTVLTGDAPLKGTLKGATSFKLVVDGALASADTVTANADGTWSAVLSVDGMTDKTVEHSFVAYIDSANVASKAMPFTVDTPFVLAAEASDPVGDDTGPVGKKYAYPTDSSFAPRQMDITKVTLSSVGTQLDIALTTRALTTVWSPFNGFDHVAFTVYVGAVGQPGLTVMPNQNAEVPAGMSWNYEIIAGGWVNALYGVEGASATATGKALSPAATIRVDAATQTVHLQISGKALGMSSLKGAKVYVTTWDYDGGYRPLVPSPDPWKMSGGDGSKEPLIMDDVPVMTIP